MSNFTLIDTISPNVTPQNPPTPPNQQIIPPHIANEIIKISKGDDSLAQCIIDYANKVDGDLMIIMTQQEANFTRMFIGSTAQEIVNNCDIPVMSIIPKEHKYKTAEEAASN